MSDLITWAFILGLLALTLLVGFLPPLQSLFF